MEAEEKRNVGAHTVHPYRDASPPNIHQNIPWISAGGAPAGFYASRSIYAIPRAPGPAWVPMVGPTEQ